MISVAKRRLVRRREVNRPDEHSGPKLSYKQEETPHTIKVRPMTVSAELADRLAFVGFDSQTRALLAKFLPTLERDLPGIIDKFYDNIQHWPDLARMFDSREAMNRAGRNQAQHWLKLFSGRFDEDYVASVKKVGLIHSRIGLEPRWYIGGYSYILRMIFDLAGRFCSGPVGVRGAAKAARLIAALNQAALIDMDLAISCYIVENEASYDRKLEKLANGFEAKISDEVNSFLANVRAA